MKEIKTVIFDFDGVIADTIDFTLEKTVAILRNYFSVKIPTTEIVTIIRTRSFKEIISDLKLSLLKLPIIVGKINESQHELNKIIGTIKMFPGIKKTLNDLKRNGFDLVIISSNLEKNVKDFIRLNNIDVFRYLDCGSHLLGKSGAIKNFLENNHLNKENVIYIGDEIRDIEACHKIGVKIISVAWGLDEIETLKAHGADYLAKKPGEIVKIIYK